MKTIIVNGKQITTNYEENYPLWNGNDIPRIYDGCMSRGFGKWVATKSETEILNDLVNAGYTRIKFVETSTRIRGYHNTVVFYGGRKEV